MAEDTDSQERTDGEGTDDQGPSRRRVLQGTAALGAAGLAGCTGSIPGVGGDGGPGTGSGGPENTEFSLADCTPESVDSNVQADTTWSPEECPRVAIDGNVVVRNGATLTIEPGVKVVGRSGARLEVRSGSTLKAQDEPTNPVWFYGENDATGYWQGIRFRSQTDNVLDNVVVRNGGRNDWSNIYLDDNSQTSVTNSTLRGEPHTASSPRAGPHWRPRTTPSRPTPRAPSGTRTRAEGPDT
jgi:hypothetical protein